LDEICGELNFVSQISVFKTTTPRNLLDNNLYYLLWYAKDIKSIKYRQPYVRKPLKEWTSETKGGSWGVSYKGVDRPLTPDEKSDPAILPDGAQVYQLTDLFSAGKSQEIVEFEFNNKVYRPRTNTHWKTGLDGLKNLALANRVEVRGDRPWFKRYHSDWTMQRVTNVWADTSGKASERIYVVQTQDKVIERCILMSTDPGDLVLDPTCGSGTTAYMSEEWGRRWITCDTSRVAVTLAKQRIMTSLFDYYELAHPQEGVGSGFKYETVPHVTLKSIAHNEPPAQETVYDKPLKDKSRAGKGAVEGVLGPGAANNSTRGGDLIPTIAFGIPGSGAMALLLGAMLIVGLNPGPEMLKSRLDVTFSMVWVLIISNIIVCALCFLILNHLAALTFIRGSLLIPFLLFLVFIGSFTANNDLYDIVTTLIFGFVGFFMVKWGWPRPPLILGLTLGKIAENYLWISTAAYGAKWLMFPSVVILIAITIFTIAYPTIKERMGKAKYERPEDAI
jgi:hypothetical protein